MITVRKILTMAQGINTVGIYNLDGEFITVVDACTVMHYLDKPVLEF